MLKMSENLNNKTCGECKNLNRELAFCRACGAKWLNESDGANCKYFERKTKPTNGDMIRQMSNMELAQKFGYPCPPKIKKKCRPFDEECFECWLAWLNAPAESEVEDE
jgi:hypothetical protein